MNPNDEPFGDPFSEETMRAGRQARLDRLFDAIDLIREDRREPARALLYNLIRENGDDAEAWLWMSVAVDSLDQSALSLENVLRIDPDHFDAAGALYNLRSRELQMEKTRARLRFWRDMSLSLFWLLVTFILFAIVFGGMAMSSAIQSAQ